MRRIGCLSCALALLTTVITGQQRGEWLAIRARRSDERWRGLLPEILERETAFLGLAQPCTRVIVCAQGTFDVELHNNWRAHAMSYRELALAAEPA